MKNTDLDFSAQSESRPSQGKLTSVLYLIGSVSTLKLNIQAILEELRLWPYFDVLLSGQASPTLTSKPAPDIFLEAARQL